MPCARIESLEARKSWVGSVGGAGRRRVKGRRRGLHLPPFSDLDLLLAPFAPAANAAGNQIFVVVRKGRETRACDCRCGGGSGGGSGSGSGGRLCLIRLTALRLCQLM